MQEREGRGGGSRGVQEREGGGGGSRGVRTKAELEDSSRIEVGEQEEEGGGGFFL